MSRIRWYGPTLLLLVTVGGAMALGPGMVRQIAQTYEQARIAQVRQDLAENPTLLSLSEAFKEVATVIRPSVTSISLLSTDSNGRLETESNGSGWVYRYFPDFEADPKDYTDYIITNHHVVDSFLRQRAEQIVVRFYDGGEYKATVIGTDRKTDIAVLQIKRKKMIAAAMVSEPAEQGEIVFAVGSPFRFDFSMSQGIVSATGRRLHDVGFGRYENFIQTDAAINPGNSGGPLINVRGEVVGMSTAIAIDGDPAKEFSGLGFAIPVAQIVDVANKLIEKGEVRRGHMGVFIYDINAATAKAMGFTGKGVLCDPVPDGPAATAGLRIGDIITHVDGRVVRTSEELRIAVARHEPGSTIPVRIWREAKKLTFQVKLIKAPPDSARGLIRNPFERRDLLKKVDALGDVRVFSPSLAQRTAQPYLPGMVVLRVEPGSPADDQGLRASQVITAVNGRAVYDLKSFNKAINAEPNQPLRLTVHRWDASGDGEYVKSAVTLPKP